MVAQLVYNEEVGGFLLPDSEENRELLRAAGADLARLSVAEEILSDTDEWYRQAVEKFDSALR